MKKKFWLTRVMALLLVACWCYPAAAYTLEVRAWVDGVSQLIIQGKNVQWHNLKSNVPGYEEQDPPGLPTYLQSRTMGEVAWSPAWSKGTNGEQWSKKFTKLKPILPVVEQTVSLTWSVDRTRDGFHEVRILQQPTASNKYTLIVEFDDDAPGSAAWYTVRLDFTPNLAWPSYIMPQGNGEYSSANAVAVSGTTLYVAGHFKPSATNEDFRLQTVDVKTGGASGEYTTDTGSQDSFALITPGKNKAFVGGVSNLDAMLYCFSPGGGTLPWGPKTFENLGINGVVNVQKQVIASTYGSGTWLVQAFDESTEEFLWEDRRGPSPWYATKGIAADKKAVYVAGWVDGGPGKGPDWYVRAINPSNNGAVIWETPPMDYQGGEDKPEAIATDGKIVVVVGYGTKTGGGRDWLVGAFDAKTGELLNKDDMVFDTAVEDGTILVRMSKGVSYIAAEVLRDSNKTWVVRAISNKNGSLVWPNEQVLSHSSEDNLYDLATDGKVLVTCGKSTIESGKEWVVWCLDAKKGTEKFFDAWQLTPGNNNVARAATVSKGKIFAVGTGHDESGDSDWTVKAYNTK